ncbi:MAG: Wzz/FepE/Etk N-terminal domain-containing protein [Pseudomonadota bacterium]
MDMSHSLQILRRRLPLVTGIVLLGTALGLAAALLTPPTYSARAVLVVEAAQMQEDLAPTTVRTNETEALQIIERRILSRDTLRALARDMAIYAPDAAPSLEDMLEDLRARILIETEGGQFRRGQRDATVVSVSFRDPVPARAAAVANELVRLILAVNAETRTSLARETRDFFTAEVTRLETELAESTTAILAFQEANLEALPDSLDFRRTQQTNLQERLGRLEREETALKDRRLQLVTLFEATGQVMLGAEPLRPTSGAARTPSRAPPAVEGYLAELKAEYATLGAVLSESNPRMVMLQTRIETALAESAALPEANLAEPGDAASAAALKRDTALFEVQRADLDAQLAYVAGQKLAAAEKMAEIEQSIGRTPGNAVALAALERSHGTLQAQYDQAVANKARAETGKIIEELSRGQRISVVEDAVAPESPSGPPRSLIALGGVSGGFVLAACLLALLEHLNRTIRTPRDLTAALGIDAFATIPYLEAPGDTTRRTSLRWGRGLLALLALGALLWGVDRHVTPLGPEAARLVSAARALF